MKDVRVELQNKIRSAKTIEEARANYIKCRTETDAAKKWTAECNSDFRLAEAKLVEIMTELDTLSTRQASGATFSVSPRLHVSLTLGNKDEVAEWLVEKCKVDRTDIVREELIPIRCRELIREIYTKEGKTRIPECLKLDDSPGITVTGWDAVQAAPSAPEV